MSGYSIPGKHFPGASWLARDETNITATFVSVNNPINPINWSCQHVYYD